MLYIIILFFIYQILFVCYLIVPMSFYIEFFILFVFILFCLLVTGVGATIGRICERLHLILICCIGISLSCSDDLFSLFVPGVRVTRSHL